MASSSAPITLSSLTFLRPTELAPLLLDPTEKAKIAIIDVRDSDHIGGNIHGSTWIPVNQLDARMPELLRTLKDMDKVVFHCMLSQQRGPKAALTYARAKQRAEEKDSESNSEEKKTAQKIMRRIFGSEELEARSSSSLSETILEERTTERGIGVTSIRFFTQGCPPDGNSPRYVFGFTERTSTTYGVNFTLSGDSGMIVTRCIEACLQCHSELLCEPTPIIAAMPESLPKGRNTATLIDSVCPDIFVTEGLNELDFLQVL